MPSKVTIKNIKHSTFKSQSRTIPHGSSHIGILAIERTKIVALFQSEFSSLLIKNKRIGTKVLVEIARTLSRRTRQLLLYEKHVPSL
jgi:hypothetical protein